MFEMLHAFLDGANVELLLGKPEIRIHLWLFHEGKS